MAKAPSKRPPEPPVSIPSTSTSADAIPSKKAKFDTRNPSRLAQSVDSEEDEDSILELDEIGKGGLRSKRNGVRLEGYDSDSENENFDNRAAARAAQKAADERKSKSQDEEAADMFGDLEDDLKDGDQDEDLSREGKKPKSVRFMDENDIEGQVSSSKSGGHVAADLSVGGKPRDTQRDESSDSEEEDDGEEYDDELGAGAKKKHAPKLDAFNMKNEQEEGKFDESGNFVRNATDPFAMHDAWLEDASKGDIKRAKAGQEKREQLIQAQTAQEDALPTHELLATVIKHLEAGETILEALQRFGQGKKKKQKPKWKKHASKSKGDSMDVDQLEDLDEKEVARRKAVEAITGAADILTGRIETDDIFDEERGVLMRLYKRETGEDWKDEQVTSDGQDSQWEYRWEDARDGGDVHGPYDGATMRSWQEAGYFGEGVRFRVVGSDKWEPSVEFA